MSAIERLVDRVRNRLDPGVSVKIWLRREAVFNAIRNPRRHIKSAL